MATKIQMGDKRSMDATTTILQDKKDLENKLNSALDETEASHREIQLLEDLLKKAKLETTD